MDSHEPITKWKMSRDLCMNHDKFDFKLIFKEFSYLLANLELYK